MPDAHPAFLKPDAPLPSYEEAEVAILPLPFERTTSWGQGTAAGPRALLEASRYLELWDEELALDPSARGILTLPPPELSDDAETALEEIRSQAARHLESGKFLVALGGEHTVTLPLVRAAAARFAELGVVQFDAHADLRDEYGGSPLSHACVMRRVLEEELSILAIGVRSLSAPEARLVGERRLPVVWGHELADLGAERFGELLEELPDRVYLTFDLDFFDPSLVPATGTPEPGGGLWYPTLGLLRELFARKRVVAMDVVELAPVAGAPASDFLAAKLIYKCLGYRQAADGEAGRGGPR